MEMRAGQVLLAWCLLGTVGCHRRGHGNEPPKVGGDLPVTSSKSVALPGSTDAADAPEAPSVVESQKADLTLYRDPGTGVSFRYPSVWRPAQDGMLPAPAFTAAAGTSRVTQVFSPEGNVYASTVLRGIAFSYTVREHSDAAACAAIPRKATESGGAQENVQYGGIHFTEARGSDAGMCTHVQSTVDTTLREERCLVFERDFITSCPYVKTQSLPRPLTDSETATLNRHLDQVMDSVQIAP